MPSDRKNSAPLSQQLDLLWQFTVRAVEVKHRGSYLGVFWNIFTPLLMLCLYFAVFGKILGIRFHVLPNETALDYALAVFLGLILFQLLAEVLGIMPSIIVATPNLVKKVVFPLEILPLSQLLAFWFNALLSLVLLLIGIATLGRGLSLGGLVWLPAILFPHFLLSVGLAMLLAALGVFFRDVTHTIQFTAQILLYASAVFYSPSTLPPGIWKVLRWNPILHIIGSARDALLWNRPVNLRHLGFSYLAAVVVLFFGWWVFRRTKLMFADVI